MPNMFNIDQSQIKISPFPHFVKDNFFEKNLFLRLSHEFPKYEFFQRKIRGQFSGGRIDAVKGNPLLNEFLQSSPLWKGVIDKIISKENFKVLLETFGNHITEFGGKIDLSRAKLVDHNDFIPKKSILNRAIRKMYRDIRMKSLVYKIQEKMCPDDFYIIYSIGWGQSGYYVGPHSDNRYKVMTFLIYFDDFPGEEGSLNLLEHKNTKNLRDCERYPPPERLRIFKNISSKANRCVGYVNSNNAYHSTVPWSGSKPRRHLYVGLCKRYSESIWDSSYFELGDLPSPNRVNGVDPLPEVPIEKVEDNLKL